jgi:hypothetical protein
LNLKKLSRPGVASTPKTTFKDPLFAGGFQVLRDLDRFQLT